MREFEYLKKSYASILSLVGMIFLLCSAVMITPLALIVFYPHEIRHAPAFLMPAVGLSFLGILLRKSFRHSGAVHLSLAEGGVIVLVSWTCAAVFSALPFMSVLKLSFSQAVFESVSGWTTSGLTVVDIAHAGPMILFWRSVLSFVGGAGLAIIMMSAIAGPTGMGISGAEGRADQLVPHVRHSSRLVMIIYSGYALAGTLAYWMAGMSLYDALNHSLAAVSTGGFSTHVESIGFWDSPVIEGVSIPLMLIGNLSFVTAWSLLRGRFRWVARNNEIRVMMMVIPVSAILVLLLTSLYIYPSMTKAVRVAIFETISALTTTGFQTVGYGNWNDFGVFILAVLMLIGGGACSTAGGLKQFRLHLLWKLMVWEIKRPFLPSSAVIEHHLWESNGKIFVSDARIRQLCVFVFIYLSIYLLGVMILCISGFSLKDAIFEFASAIGNAGLSVGVTSAQMPLLAMWAITLAMFLGRLEFLVVIVSGIKLVRDGRRMMAGKKKRHR